jgi:hypothetical protein
VGGPALKRPYTCFRGGPPAEQPACGHLTTPLDTPCHTPMHPTAACDCFGKAVTPTWFELQCDWLLQSDKWTRFFLPILYQKVRHNNSSSKWEENRNRRCGAVGSRGSLGGTWGTMNSRSGPLEAGVCGRPRQAAGAARGYDALRGASRTTGTTSHMGLRGRRGLQEREK